MIICLNGKNGWVGGKYVCVNLNRVSTLVGFGGEPFTVAQTALKVASNKAVKH